jgi:hypothetical protein
MSIHLPRVNVIFYAASYRCAITESRSFLLPARSDILRESFNKNFYTGYRNVAELFVIYVNDGEGLLLQRKRKCHDHYTRPEVRT